MEKPMSPGKRIDLADILPFMQLIARYCQLAMLESAPTSAKSASLNGSSSRTTQQSEDTEDDDAPRGTTEAPPLIRDRTYTIAEAALLLNVAKVTIRKRLQKGKIKASRDSRQRVWIRGDEIARLKVQQGDLSIEAPDQPQPQ
jgi:excisionase family DNA binding protein